MAGSAFVYGGLIATLAGLVLMLRPITRRRGMLMLLPGLLVVAAGFALPAPEMRIGVPRTMLDRFAPVYQFHEVHSILIEAPKETVWRALRTTSADDIFLFRTLVWIRRLGRKGPESILNAPERQPLLDVATRTTFLKLAEEPAREIVIGTIVLARRGWRSDGRATPEGFRTLQDPGFALATMNFLIEDSAPGVCRLTTETRVHATDAWARRRFAAYWRVIYPGSALIRRMWLRAIAEQARVRNVSGDEPEQGQRGPVGRRGT